MALRRDTLLAVLTGIVAMAGGRIAYVLLISIVSHLSSEPSGGAAGSLQWVFKMFFSPLGWISYTLWGSLIGLAYARINPLNRRVLVIALCMFLLFIHDTLWYHGGSYRFNMDIARLGRLFAVEFWQRAWLLLLLWFIPHITSAAFLSVWKHGIETWFEPAPPKLRVRS